jgi:endoglucanase
VRRTLWLLLATAWGAGHAGVVPTAEIKIDQVGYLPGAPKLAMVVSAATPSRFVVRDVRDGRSAYAGVLSSPLLDPDSGDRVQVADFSALRTPGVYYLEAPGIGRSWNFEIAPDVYARAFYLAMRAFYGQRCGAAVDLAPPFPAYKHAICHRSGAYHQSSGHSGPGPSVRGWHDAGDYGRYVVNSGITTGTLLWAYELFGSRVGRVRLDLPESGDETPDMLDEIRWNLDWLLSMQDADGGVWHKQTSDRFPSFVMPERDPFESFVIGTGAPPWKSSCATGDLAAVMAIAARVYEPFDAAYAGRCLRAARLAWDWIERHPDVAFSNPNGVSTGEYGDRDCGDERLWAAAELWRTSGGEQYHRYVLQHYAKYRLTIRSAGPASWARIGPLAIWSYLLTPQAQADVAAALRQDTLAAADEIVTRTARHPYRTSMTTADYVWGSNSVAANYGVQLLIANVLRPDARYAEAAIENLHYLLGRNTFSLSWVTRLGDNPVRRPHHRPSGADTNEEPWPGLLAGGPNRNRQDPAMKRLPDLPPARMYLDDQESYATNEVAINWNAPLVFLLAAAAYLGHTP